ncbi:hypothetical protein BRD17_01015 [Halobacteriales archaeon SW_7_68_16]|nr:MAG: hypothetical protein BRD17_01015 [Halobacteriales archaeon SW_7_68_16]
MQRRVVGLYIVLFVVLSVGAYAMVTTAQPPTISIENPDHELANGSDLTVDGRQYRVVELTASVESGGGHGGGGGVTHSAVLESTALVETATGSLADGDAVTYNGTEYVVLIPNASDPATVRFREPLDDDVETVERDGETFVVVDRDGDGTDELVAPNEYGALDRVTIAEGRLLDGIEWSGVDGPPDDVSVGNVTTAEVPLSWRVTDTIEFGSEQNVTINGRQHFAYFPSNETAVLTTDYADYEEDTRRIEAYRTRTNGLWGVTIVGGVGLTLLVVLAFLPRRE